MAFRKDIKPKFETNDIPSQGDFYEVFDSFLNKGEDKATAEMVDEGIDDEHYVTPALLRVGLQNMGAIKGGGNLPYKQHADNFEGNYFILDWSPIESSVKVFKNGQLLLEGEDADYTVDYETGSVLFLDSVVNRNIEINYWYKSTEPIPGNGTNYVDLTTNQTVAGNKTFTGITTLTAPAISGRESLLKGTISDNGVDMFQVANGTTVGSRFIPTFISYTEGGYQSMLFRGLGKTDDDLSNSSPYIQFLAANTSSSSDPNNGVLTIPVSRDLFTWGSVDDYMRMKADGRVLIGSPFDDLTSKLQVSGSVKSNNFIKSGGTSDDILLADGTTMSLSGLGGGSSPLSVLDEGNGNGYRLANADPLNFGNIGPDALDFSYSETPSDVLGATGTSAFAMGSDVIASNFYSTVFGYLIDNNGIGSFDSGFNLKDNGYTNSLFGIGHDVTSMNTTVVGQASNIISDQIADFNFTANKKLFVVGNGTIQNADYNYTVNTRSDAFVVRLNGSVEAPSLTNALINADTTGKSLVTKEYLALNSVVALQKEITTTAYTILPADLNYTIFFNSASPLTVTLNAGLPNNFECDFYNLGTGAVSFVSGTATLSMPDGASLAKDKVASLIRVMSTANYKLKGELV